MYWRNLVLVIKAGVPCRSFEFLPNVLFKLHSGLWVSFSFLFPCWSESELVVVMVFMCYKWDISLFKVAGKYSNYFFPLYTHSFWYSFVFNICLFRNVSSVFRPISVNSFSVAAMSLLIFLSEPDCFLVGSFVLRFWISFGEQYSSLFWQTSTFPFREVRVSKMSVEIKNKKWKWQSKSNKKIKLCLKRKNSIKGRKIR